MANNVGRKLLCLVPVDEARPVTKHRLAIPPSLFPSEFQYIS